MRFRGAGLAIGILAIGSFVACGKSSTNSSQNATLSSVTVSGPSANLDLTATEQFSATGHYSDGSTEDLSSTVTWSSSASSIASVSNSGVATGLAAGYARIIATYHEASGSANLTVNAPTSITLTPIGPAVGVGGSVQLHATGSFSDNPSGINLTNVVSWSSSASSAASVSSAGMVAGVAAGVATITATSGTVSGSTAVNVTSPSGQTFGNGSLTSSSSYAFFLTSIDSRGQAVVVGSFTTDGNGNIVSGSADFNTATGVSSSGPVSLTASHYNVWPDGRGEATISLSNGQSFHFAFILSDLVSGVANQGKMIAFDANKALGTFELQTAGANLNGSYVFALNGLDASNRQEAEIGLFSTSPSGTNVFDVNDNGTVDGGTNPPPATGQTLSPVTINAVSAGNRGTATLGAAGYAYYTIDNTKAYFIETDGTSGSTALAGVAEQQTAVEVLSPEDPTSPCESGDAESTCNYAFLLNHAASAQNGTFERAGQFNFCACTTGGGIDHANENDSDGSTWTLTSGTRLFNSSGRGVLQYDVANTANPGGETRYAIAYTVSRTQSSTITQASATFYMMNTDSTSPGVGEADFIDVDLTTLNTMPAAGIYALSASNIGNTNLLELGQVALDASGNMTGISYVNNNGVLSAVAVSGVFTPSTDVTNGGSGLGTISPFNGITTSLEGYVVGSESLVVLNTKSFINGRLEMQ